MSYCNNNTHNINITPNLSYVMEHKSNKQSVQADGSDGEKMSATDRLQEVEDRLDNVDIEDMADRLEIVEDWDASDRLSDVESDLEDLQSRVEALEGKSK